MKTGPWVWERVVKKMPKDPASITPKPRDEYMQNCSSNNPQRISSTAARLSSELQVSVVNLLLDWLYFL